MAGDPSLGSGGTEQRGSFGDLPDPPNPLPARNTLLRGSVAIPRDHLMPMLESIILMRRVEEMACELGPNEVFGNYHVYMGQEATGASVISQLRPEDPVFTTHRCHAH